MNKEEIRRRMCEVMPGKQAKIKKSRQEIKDGKFVVVVDKPDDDLKECAECGGTGKRDTSHSGYQLSHPTCPQCGGSGKVK